MSLQEPEDELPGARDSAILEPRQPGLAWETAGLSARALFVHPVFLVVLALKLLVGALFASSYLRELFVPFVSYFAETGSNPWEAFHATGRLDSFPYTPLMLLILAVPRWLASPLLPDAWDAVGCGHLVVMRLPLLLADVAIYAALCALLPHRIDRVRWLYWASPLVIYVCYWHGQLDVIPSALLLLGVAATLQRRWAWGAALLGCALATKMHVLVAFPFLAVFLWRERGRGTALVVVALACLVYGAAVLPVIHSDAFRHMVYGSEKQGRVFALALQLGDARLLACPAALLVLLLRFAAYPRRNADLVVLYLGVAFAVFLVLVPPMPGWALWAFPFLVYACAKSTEIPSSLLPVFSAAYVAYFLVAPGSDLFDAFAVVAPGVAALGEPAQVLERWGLPPRLVVDTSFTIMETSLVVVIFATYRFGVRSNEIYRGERPTMIGVAGDSGAGKDTLTGLVSRALGVEQATVVSGDDYHRWPRGHEAWQVHTHLDLRSNRLHDMAGHAIALGARHAIRKVAYDHATGTFTDVKTVTPTDFVYFVGLHTFVIERMRALFDVRIFVDPDEQLRLLWKLRRDVRHRGTSPERTLETLERRRPDREKHVLPQRRYADLVVSFYPLAPIALDDLEALPPLGVRFRGKNSFNLDRVAEVLRGRAGLFVEDGPEEDLTFHSLDLHGQISATEVRRLIQELVPNLEDLTQGYRSTFHADLPGLVQLVVVYCVSQARRWRADPAREARSGSWL